MVGEEIEILLNVRRSTFPVSRFSVALTPSEGALVPVTTNSNSTINENLAASANRGSELISNNISQTPRVFQCTFQVWVSKFYTLMEEILVMIPKSYHLAV